ncbi:hypothetical protein T11_8284, partial [Trichinella zimbabwensis]
MEPACLHFSNGNIYEVLVKYSLKLRTLVQYFFVLGNPIFLHFPSISIDMMKVVSSRFQM